MAFVSGIEPITEGKAIIHTSHGDLNVNFWPKQAPLAVRNFVQLALEGYYDNTIFHRIIKGMMIQGGDPTGTGYGGESIYGDNFKDEINSRLKFTHRGLLAMANANEPNSNGSQFFITLDKCEWLNGKHTIFATIPDESFYNCLRMSELDTDSNDRPEFPPIINSIEIVVNPFPDIVPRKIEKVSPEIEEISIKKIKPKKANLQLLSFGNEVEELNTVIDKKQLRGIKPSPSVIQETKENKENKENKEINSNESLLTKNKNENKKLVDEMRSKILEKTQNAKQETIEKKETKKKTKVVDEYIQQRGKYLSYKDSKKMANSNIESIMKDFKLKLNQAWSEKSKSEKDSHNEKDLDMKTGIVNKKDIDSESDDDNDSGWMSSQLKFTKHQDDDLRMGHEFTADDYVTLYPNTDDKNITRSEDSYTRRKNIPDNKVYHTIDIHSNNTDSHQQKRSLDTYKQEDTKHRREHNNNYSHSHHHDQKDTDKEHSNKYNNNTYSSRKTSSSRDRSYSHHHSTSRRH